MRIFFALIFAATVAGPPLRSAEIGAEARVVYYGIFDTERNPDLIASHAGNGLRGIRFAAGPRRTGNASMELDIALPDQKTSGRWIFPIPHVRFHEISFWLHTGRLGNTKLEITPTLLGSDRQVMQFRPVVLAGGEGWRRILLRIPEDVAKLQNDPKFAAINDVPATSFDERTYLLFSFGIRIARENPVTTWSGPIYLDQLEFLQRTR